MCVCRSSKLGMQSEVRLGTRPSLHDELLTRRRRALLLIVCETLPLASQSSSQPSGDGHCDVRSRMWSELRCVRLGRRGTLKADRPVYRRVAVLCGSQSRTKSTRTSDRQEPEAIDSTSPGTLLRQSYQHGQLMRRNRTSTNHTHRWDRLRTQGSRQSSNGSESSRTGLFAYTVPPVRRLQPTSRSPAHGEQWAVIAHGVLTSSTSDLAPYTHTSVEYGA